MLPRAEPHLLLTATVVIAVAMDTEQPNADTTSSTVEPTLDSTPNPPIPTTSTSNHVSPEPTDSALGGDGEIASSSAAIPVTQEKPTEGGPVTDVPVRSSSTAKTQIPSTTSTVEKSAEDPTSLSPKESKGSIRPKSQSGGVAETKVIETGKASTLTAADPEKLGGGEKGANKTKPKKKGGFLSFLNCCSAPENAHTVEGGDQAVPAKKAKVLQQRPGRQPTPVVKANASAGESSAGESKEIVEEGIGGPEYSEHKPAAKPTMITRSSKDKVAAEKPMPQAPVPSAAETTEPSAATETRDSPLPPLPASIVSSPPEASAGQSTEAPPVIASTAPPQLIEPDESVAEQGTTINDRTPQQEQADSDIAMVDAPPLATAVEEPPPPTTARELTQAQVNLPPPPPRNGQETATSGPSAVNTPSDKQRWLLPPLQPHFQGRKCLVLDLDETLVHSSFKVRALIVFCFYELISPDPPPSRLHHPR